MSGKHTPGLSGRKPGLVTMLAGVLWAALNGNVGAGRAALQDLANSPAPTSFGMRYGADPRPLNGGHGRGAAARIRRIAKRDRNIQARASKRSF